MIDGNLLRNIRLSLHLTQEEVAHFIGVSDNYISKAENGTLKLLTPSDILCRIQNFIDNNKHQVALIQEHSYSISDIKPQERAKALEHECILRYLGKQGKHHVFKSVRGGWSRTYTDAQLIGKFIQEVTT